MTYSEAMKLLVQQMKIYDGGRMVEALEIAIEAVNDKRKMMRGNNLNKKNHPGVVHCRDCKYCISGTDKTGRSCLRCNGAMMPHFIDSDDYCSRAEKKEKKDDA